MYRKKASSLYTSKISRNPHVFPLFQKIRHLLLHVVVEISSKKLGISINSSEIEI